MVGVGWIIEAQGELLTVRGIKPNETDAEIVSHGRDDWQKGQAKEV
jgi:hypothetical protein